MPFSERSSEMKFSEMNLKPFIMYALAELGFIEATPVQQQVYETLKKRQNIIVESATGSGVKGSINGGVDYHVDVQSVLDALTTSGDEGKTVGVDGLVCADNVAAATERDIAATLDGGVRNGTFGRCGDMNSNVEDRVTLGGGCIGDGILEVGFGGVGDAVPCYAFADGGVNVGANAISVDGKVEGVELSTSACLRVSIDSVDEDGVGGEGVATPNEFLADDCVEGCATRILEGEGQGDCAVTTETVGKSVVVGTVGGIGLTAPLVFASSGYASGVAASVVNLEVKDIESVVTHQEGNGVAGVGDAIDPCEAFASDF